MLKQMREGFSHLKWILFLIIFVFVLLVFANWGGGGAGGQDVPKGYAARVNGDLVSLEDYSRALYNTEKQYEQVYGQPMTEEMRKSLDLRRQVMQSLVNQRLLLQQARRLHLGATPAEVKSKILQIPALSPDGKFVGAQLYQRYVTTALGYGNPADFEDDLAQDITLSKMESAMMSSIIVPPSLAEAQYRQQNESTSISYVMVPASQMVAGVSVAPAEVESYYRSHTEDYTHQAQRHVKYLLADMAKIRSQVNVTDAQTREAYETSKESYKSGEQAHARHILIKTGQGATPAEIAKAKQQAEDIVRRLKSGEDFAKLAKEYSDDPGSAAQGGDLGWFEKGRMVPEFDQAVFSTPVGQVAGPVQSQFGFHIIEVLGKRPAGIRSFEEVRPEIERNLTEQRAAEMAREQIAQVRARIQEGAKKSEKEMRDYASDFITYNDAGWLGKKDIVQGLGRVPQFNDWAFSAAQDDVGPVVQTPRGPALPHLVGSRDAGVTPLNEIRGKVEADARMAKAREAAKQKLASAFTAGKPLDEVASAVGSEVKTANLKPNSPIAGIPGSTRALSSAAMKTDVGAEGGPVVVDQGAVVFKVESQNRFDPKQFEQQKPQLIQSLQQQEAQKLRMSLLDRLRQSAKVDINEDLLKSDDERSRG